MRTIEVIERQVRDLGRNVVPDIAKRYLWFYYMMAKKVLETKRFDLFATVQLEVNTNCNRSCLYCSNSLFPKKQEYMDERLFQKVIDELAVVNFSGRILPHCVSEPLLHPGLVDLVTYAKKAEKARVEIFTNGDFLDRKRFNDLRKAGVDGFLITQHDKEAYQPLLNLLASLTRSERKDVIYRNLDTFHLFNRGIPGLIQPEKRSIPNPCFIADYYLQILVNGDIAQCCNDFKGENVFGNVYKKDVVDIWNDPSYMNFRREVRLGQFNSDICQRCVFDNSK